MVIYVKIFSIESWLFCKKNPSCEQIHICIYVCMFMCIYIYIYMYIYVYMYICIHTHMCVCVLIFSVVCMRNQNLPGGMLMTCMTQLSFPFWMHVLFWPWCVQCIHVCPIYGILVWLCVWVLSGSFSSRVQSTTFFIGEFVE